MIYGYCRISRKTQNIERQIRNIQESYPSALIIQEAYTGTKVVGRKEFEKLVQKVKPGDTIVFDSVSRMSRNAAEGFELYKKWYDDTILCNTKDIKDDIEKFASEYEDIQLRFWYDLDDYGEFYPSSISKATSLEKLIKDHQIKRDDVIAIGDGNNDFEMLSLASLSFAMKNGSAELKSKSRYVTEYTNDEDGVYHVLKDIFD